MLLLNILYISTVLETVLLSVGINSAVHYVSKHSIDPTGNVVCITTGRSLPKYSNLKIPCPFSQISNAIWLWFILVVRYYKVLVFSFKVKHKLKRTLKFWFHSIYNLKTRGEKIILNLTSDILLLWVTVPTMSPLIWTASPEGVPRVLPIWLLDVKDLLLCILMIPSLFSWLLGVRGRDSKLFGVTGLFPVDGIGCLLVCMLGVWGLLFEILQTWVLLLLGSGGDLFPCSWSWTFFPDWVGTWGLEFWLGVAWRFPWWSEVTKLVGWLLGLLDSLASSQSAKSFSMSACRKRQ